MISWDMSGIFEVISWDMSGIYSDFMGYEWDIPSGKRLQNIMGNHHAING